MLQNYSRYRILELFFLYPHKSFYIREISRLTNLAQPSVKNHLNALLSDGLIKKEEKGLYPVFSADLSQKHHKVLKKQHLIQNLQKKGFVDYIENELRPNCIVVFGSASKGEDSEKSDIDIFIQAKQSKLDLRKFEKALNRKIHTFFESNIKKIPKELLNNIINGEVISGYLKVF
ncbi:nucleotidyltransferase domain-containing protein [Nanoarchaeota archaeon]